MPAFLSLLLASAAAAADAPKVTFLRDVAPILNKVGCTSGPCHGAAKGKNGFKLSLRGYDPQFDYEALLYDLSGRRFNRAEPGRSLMLAKPTQQVAHGGGLRFEISSDYYKTIYNWIAQGVPFGDPATDTVKRLFDAKRQRLKIQPSGMVDDAGFLRRVSLDLAGQLPAPEEVRAFVADPSKNKRAAIVDKLIASPAYVDHWTLKWGDLLQNNRKYLGEKGAFEFREWIREAIADNRPYDRMVREMLTSRGSSYDNPAANFYRVTREPKPTMEKTTQVFLGVRMVCAQCHDHPFERWTQNQYYQMSAFFSAVGIRAGYEVGEEIVFDQRSDYEMKHPKDGRVMKPQFMLASSVAPVADGPQRPDALAEWITAKHNHFFARALANRMWSYFLGKGSI